jgi:hypothetical protein
LTTLAKYGMTQYVKEKATAALAELTRARNGDGRPKKLDRMLTNVRRVESMVAGEESDGEGDGRI